MTCPLCNKSLAWRKTDLDEWVPCDEEPILYVKDSGKTKIYKKREIIDGCSIYIPGKHKERPEYGRLPHYYSCEILKAERREWAKDNRR